MNGDGFFTKKNTRTHTFDYSSDHFLVRIMGYSPILEIISEKFIKPATPTPPLLRYYKLSLMDQLIADLYIPIVFFFPSDQAHNKSAQISAHLENSLSRVLTSYYPLAGTRIDSMSIDCNDRGAKFFQVKVNCTMTQALKEPIGNASNIVFPSGLTWNKNSSVRTKDSLLIGQLSYFDCGGVSLSVTMSHKFGDMQTLSNFVSDWAALAQKSGDEIEPPPQLDVASIFPPVDDSFIKPSLGPSPTTQGWVTKRFVFDASRLKKLKAKAAAESGVDNPTRTEVVTALLFKCIKTASAAGELLLPSDESRTLSLLLQAVNLRSFLAPPISSQSVGNIVTTFTVPIRDTVARELSVLNLVTELRRSKVQFHEKFKWLAADELRSVYLDDAETLRKVSTSKNGIKYDINVFSSWCSFPLYQVDFGWGRPERVSIADITLQKYCVLMDYQNGHGIEAFVPLPEEVMRIFETDPELLEFAFPG